MKSNFQRWIEATTGFNWPTQAIWPDPSASSIHSCDSRPEADLHMHSSPCSNNIKHLPSNKNPEQDLSSHSVSCSNCQKLENCLDSKKHSVSNKEHVSKNCKNTMSDKSNDDVDKKLDTKNNLDCSFHQQLVLNQRDRSSLSEMAEDDEITFDEGPFLKMLFKLLMNMPSQPYHINLQLTAIFSKLAMMPHPYLHEYLLNPILPTGKNVTTLFKTLQKLSKVFMSQIPKVKRFNSLIEETRQRLLGDESFEDRYNTGFLPKRLHKIIRFIFFFSEKSDPLFESLIVVEEFCKELAAIYFVKYHHSSQTNS